MGWRDRVNVKGSIDAGSVLKESLAIIGSNAPQFTALTVMTFLPVIAVFGWMVAITVGEDTDAQVWLYEHLVPFQIGLTGIIIIATWALSGMLVYGVYQHIRGRPVRVGDCMAVGMRRLPGVLGTSLIVGLLTALGFAACIVPGIMVACMLWVALPATVIERCNPIQAINRSTALTTGTRWPIFAVLFVIGLAQKACEFAVDAPFDDDVPGQLGTELALRLVLLLVFSLWTAVAPVVGYSDLRRMREGLEVDDLAAVFD